MYKLAAVVSVILFASCAPPKYRYFFAPVESPKADDLTSSTIPNQTSPIKNNGVSTAALNVPIYDRQLVVIDTDIISKNDTLPSPKQDSKSSAQSTKEQNKKTYLEKKKAYHDAKKVYEKRKLVHWPDKATRKLALKEARDDMVKADVEAKVAYAATRDKRFNILAIAGAVYFTVAFACLMYPLPALILAILGLIASILGLKSKIWGLSVGYLIGAAVVVSLYIFMSVMVWSVE